MDYFRHQNYGAPIKTVLRYDDVAIAVPIAFESAEKRAPSLKTVAKLIAQSSLETSHYQEMWNYNFGNVKKRWQSEDPRLFTGRQAPVVRPTACQTHFRAFDSAAGGVLDWLRLILTAKRYVPAKQVLVDDAAFGRDFAFELGKCGYYTVDKDLYSKSADSLTESTLRKLRDRKPPSASPAAPQDPLTDAERERVLGLVGLTNAEAIYDYFRGSATNDDDEKIT